MPCQGLLRNSSLAWLVGVVALLSWVSLGSADTLDHCPSWLEEYKDFHAKHRGLKDASYIIFHCPRHINCNGIGDRVKGIMYLLRLAALYDKVLLVNWRAPSHAALHLYLEPAQVDWRLTGLDTTALLDDTVSSDFDGGLSLNKHPSLKELLQRQDHMEEFQALKVMKTQLNWDPTEHLAGSEDGAFMDQHGAMQFSRCLFHFLFKPVDSLVQDAATALTQLYGPTPHPYMAWHWRTGGQLDELILARRSTTHDNGASRLHQLMAMLECGEAVASEAGILPPSQKPLLLLTDHNLIRQFVAAGHLSRITTINSTVAHTRQTHNYRVAKEHVRTSWVDLMILAQADCLLYSGSGYSMTALWASNTTCYLAMHECLVETSSSFHGLEV